MCNCAVIIFYKFLTYIRYSGISRMIFLSVPINKTFLAGLWLITYAISPITPIVSSIILKRCQFCICEGQCGEHRDMAGSWVYIPVRRFIRFMMRMQILLFRMFNLPVISNAVLQRIKLFHSNFQGPLGCNRVHY